MTVEIQTEIRLNCDDGGQAFFMSRYAALTDAAALDMSVLGRDISQFFVLVVDKPGNVVCLVNQNHGYRITSV